MLRTCLRALLITQRLSTFTHTKPLFLQLNRTNLVRTYAVPRTKKDDRDNSDTDIDYDTDEDTSPVRKIQKKIKKPIESKQQEQLKSVRQQKELEGMKEIYKPYDSLIPATITKVRVVNSVTKEFLGEMSRENAQSIAKNMEMNLILWNEGNENDSNSPLCKIGDYNEYLREQKAKLIQRIQEEEAELARQESAKELHFTSKIQQHDLQTKVRKMMTFLQTGDVKVQIKTTDRTEGMQALARIFAAATDAAANCEPPYKITMTQDKTSGNAIICYFQKGK
jgi:translation initiation factor IF-3